MTTKYFFASLTRISDLPEVSFSAELLPREVRGTGDYVLGEVDSSPSNLGRIELTSGRTVEVVEGGLILVRSASATRPSKRSVNGAT